MDSDYKPSAYEQLVRKNIQRNEARLKSLGLMIGGETDVETRRRESELGRKRGRAQSDEEFFPGGEQQTRKRQRATSEAPAPERRSKRLQQQQQQSATEETVIPANVEGASGEGTATTIADVVMDEEDDEDHQKAQTN